MIFILAGLVFGVILMSLGLTALAKSVSGSIKNTFLDALTYVSGCLLCGGGLLAVGVSLAFAMEMFWPS